MTVTKALTLIKGCKRCDLTPSSGPGVDAQQLRARVLLETCAHSGDHQLCHLLMAVTSDVSMPFCCATC